jgi:hypothetical protein
MFKKCTNCGYIWKNREDFLADPDIEIIGYQALFEEIKDGLFLFNHMCETTLATNVIDFNDLYKGPVFDMSLADTDECSKECYDINNLDACGARKLNTKVLSLPKIFSHYLKIKERQKCVRIKFRLLANIFTFEVQILS